MNALEMIKATENTRIATKVMETICYEEYLKSIEDYVNKVLKNELSTYTNDLKDFKTRILLPYGIDREIDKNGRYTNNFRLTPLIRKPISEYSDNRPDYVVNDNIKIPFRIVKEYFSKLGYSIKYDYTGGNFETDYYYSYGNGRNPYFVIALEFDKALFN